MKIKARLVQLRHWLSIRRVGLLAGLVAALVMTLILLVVRTIFGAPTPSELIADRTAPFLPLPVFFVMLGAAGGYSNLKGFEVVSTILGQLAVGALGGAVYEQLRVSQSAATSRFGRLVGSVRGGLFVAGMVLAAWVLWLLLFWPLFPTNYDGRTVEAARFGSIIGLLVAFACYGLIVPFAYGFVAKRRADESAATPVQGNGRRAFVLGGIGALLALGSGALLTRLYRQATFFYDGMQYLGPDIQPITPNDRFYAVTKNIVDPQVMPSQWRLAVDGVVVRPQVYDLAALMGFPQVRQETTLMCISNEVPGGLMSNAVWQGVPLATLIEAAGPQSSVVEVLLHAADGYTDTIPFAKALDPTTLLVYAMNGEPLPERHGYPARLLVPGLYGEKSVKWITRVELVDQDVQGFYERQGWGPNFTIRPRARIDQPIGDVVIAAGTPSVPISGVAFGGNHGVSRVDVSLDDGQSWHIATLDHTSSPSAWVFWKYAWPMPRPGRYTIAARATDGDGLLQTAEVHGTASEGATGYHRITVQINA